jgi:transcriptional regulator GlxA family with amidase domain
MEKRFGFLTFEGTEELDLVGAWEIVGLWRDFAAGPELITVGPQTGIVTCSRGLRLEVSYDFFNCPALDYLLVPGGKGARTQRYDAATIQFIRDRFDSCDYLLSVCTGSLVVYETGLLKGKKVTTYHLIKEELQKHGNIQLIDARYQRDGKIWTSAGISAGIDMLLAFIADVAGEETAGQVQYLCEYYPEQKYYPFHQAAPAYQKKPESQT